MKKYNVDKIISTLLAGLGSRQKDVLAGRYGLQIEQPLTLAGIGGKYNVTRERIRQVEALALGAVRAKFSNGDPKDLVVAFKKHFNKLGGLHKEESLYNEAKVFLIGSNSRIYANKVKFILESSGAFRYYPETNDFYAFWCADEQAVGKANALIAKLASAVSDQKERLVLKNNFNQLLNQTIKTIDCSKPVVLNYLSISKRFASNVYSDFGLSHWPEICPKTSRDWAYLVLKKEGQPLHFTHLTKVINKLRDSKKTNPQTVHNELIKDGRFVLVGRGTYGLKEFNLVSGTAREVIVKILNEHGPQRSRDLVQLVLEKRAFKENTLLLNLQDRRYFQRLDDGRYIIKKV